MDLNKFDEPFSPEDIEWRIQQSGKTRDGKVWAAGIAIDNLEAKCAKMAAENTSLKQSEKEFNDFCREEFSEWEDDVTETPATDAFLAEVRAQGVEMAMEHMQSSGSLTFGDCYISLNEFAAELRKGGNQ